VSAADDENDGQATERVVIRDRRKIDPKAESKAKSAAEVKDKPSVGAHRAADPEEVPVAPIDDKSPALGAELEALRSDLDERTHDLQRVTAEYANYRRRVDRDRSLVVDQAAERFALQLFPIVDDIERARDHGDLTGAFKVVAERVLGLLDGLSVEAFGVAGDPFDPSLHEAVIHDTSSEVSVPTATTVLRQGFRRGDRVLRTAMVAVTDPESPVATPGDAPPAG
jgi:molecular chaperone GrpE